MINGYDPGRCNQQSHGKEVLVKDREDNDKALTCVKESNNYLWISADGEVTCNSSERQIKDIINILLYPILPISHSKNVQMTQFGSHVLLLTRLVVTVGSILEENV